MLLSYALFALLAFAVFVVGRSWSRWVRVTAALLVLLVPSTAVTILLVSVGDRAPPDAVIVQPRPK